MSTDFALKKVLESDLSGTSEYMILAWPADLRFTKAMAYDGSNRLQYLGYALPGSSKAAPVWLIKLLTYNAGGYQTDEQYAGGKANFNQIWNDRASLSFS